MKNTWKKLTAFVLLMMLLVTLIPAQAITEKASAAESGMMPPADARDISAYTVEFTYKDSQYVLQNDGCAKLDDIWAYVGITGEASSWQSSNAALFDIVMGSEAGPGFGMIPWVVSYQPFASEEWLNVTTRDGVTYHIIVTDAIWGDGTEKDIPGLAQGEGLKGFAPFIPVADIWVDSSKFYAQSSHVNGTWSEFQPGALMTAPNSPFKVDEPAGQGRARLQVTPADISSIMTLRYSR